MKSRKFNKKYEYQYKNLYEHITELSLVRSECKCIYSGVFRIWQRGGHGERAEREPIMGVWGQSPQRGPGAEPLVGRSGGLGPPEAETLFAFERSMEAANSPTFF